ncbi:family 43 glycosylhydrolase [Filimonas effusa]|uniref:Carbohydrate-binding protein n=1 Tax=Filimonas effusa TaxID=2508721 RepID=A0A4V1MAD6_9BACT|nr:family 43 glycosylhydrolase [Filimonas effusa]RXK85506.1 carbohydrate-binding protein [Filimonas effusa]
MKKRFIYILLALATTAVNAQNPFITDQFSADPSARVFGNRVYVYPSHDILCTEGKGRPGWFCMADYHVFSSANLTDWTDHGVIVSQDNVEWVDASGYSMWAPDCIFRNGKYYFYFPARGKDTTKGKGFSIGVAVASKPEGPFTPQPEPIKKVHGIDPNVFIDKDGQAYLYWSQGHIYVAKLKANMLELDGEPSIIANLPTEGLKEGPYLFERNGKYYLTYPHVQNKIERLEYAMGDHPMGPFKVTGVIMDESETGCWTNHQSVISFNGQWYLFYHHNDLSPQFDKNRSIRIDSLFFEPGGAIRKVIPTLRGVGLTNATHPIQIDRYSHRSTKGVSIQFLDTANTFAGWKTVFNSRKAWIQYNSVDFGKKVLKNLVVRAQSAAGAKLQVRLDRPDGPVMAECRIAESGNWQLSKATVVNFIPGVHNLVVTMNDGSQCELDWLRFE